MINMKLTIYASNDQKISPKLLSTIPSYLLLHNDQHLMKNNPKKSLFLLIPLPQTRNEQEKTKGTVQKIKYRDAPFRKNRFLSLLTKEDSSKARNRNPNKNINAKISKQNSNTHTRNTKYQQENLATLNKMEAETHKTFLGTVKDKLNAKDIMMNLKSQKKANKCNTKNCICYCKEKKCIFQSSKNSSLGMLGSLRKDKRERINQRRANDGNTRQNILQQISPKLYHKNLYELHIPSQINSFPAQYYSHKESNILRLPVLYGMTPNVLFRVVGNERKFINIGFPFISFEDRLNFLESNTREQHRPIVFQDSYPDSFVTHRRNRFKDPTVSITLPSINHIDATSFMEIESNLESYDSIGITVKNQEHFPKLNTEALNNYSMSKTETNFYSSYSTDVTEKNSTATLSNLDEMINKSEDFRTTTIRNQDGDFFKLTSFSIDDTTTNSRSVITYPSIMYNGKFKNIEECIKLFSRDVCIFNTSEMLTEQTQKNNMNEHSIIRIPEYVVQSSTKTRTTLNNVNSKFKSIDTYLASKSLANGIEKINADWKENDSTNIKSHVNTDEVSPHKFYHYLSTKQIDKIDDENKPFNNVKNTSISIKTFMNKTDDEIMITVRNKLGKSKNYVTKLFLNPNDKEITKPASNKEFFYSGRISHASSNNEEATNLEIDQQNWVTRVNSWNNTYKEETTVTSYDSKTEYNINEKSRNVKEINTNIYHKKKTRQEQFKEETTTNSPDFKTGYNFEEETTNGLVESRINGYSEEETFQKKHKEVTTVTHAPGIEYDFEKKNTNGLKKSKTGIYSGNEILRQRLEKKAKKIEVKTNIYPEKEILQEQPTTMEYFNYEISNNIKEESIRNTFTPTIISSTMIKDSHEKEKYITDVTKIKDINVQNEEETDNSSLWQQQSISNLTLAKESSNEYNTTELMEERFSKYHEIDVTNKNTRNDNNKSEINYNLSEDSKYLENYYIDDESIKIAATTPTFMQETLPYYSITEVSDNIISENMVGDRSIEEKLELKLDGKTLSTLTNNLISVIDEKYENQGSNITVTSSIDEIDPVIVLERIKYNLSPIKYYSPDILKHIKNHCMKDKNVEVITVTTNSMQKASFDYAQVSNDTISQNTAKNVADEIKYTSNRETLGTVTDNLISSINGNNRNHESNVVPSTDKDIVRLQQQNFTTKDNIFKIHKATTEFQRIYAKTTFLKAMSCVNGDPGINSSLSVYEDTINSKNINSNSSNDSNNLIDNKMNNIDSIAEVNEVIISSSESSSLGDSFEPFFSSTTSDNILELQKSRLYYINDDVEFPLEIIRLKNGSYALSISKNICEHILNRKCPCCVPLQGYVIQTSKTNHCQDDLHTITSRIIGEKNREDVYISDVKINYQSNYQSSSTVTTGTITRENTLRIQKPKEEEKRTDAHCLWKRNMNDNDLSTISMSIINFANKYNLLLDFNEEVLLNETELYHKTQNYDNLLMKSFQGFEYNQSEKKNFYNNGMKKNSLVGKDESAADKNQDLANVQKKADTLKKNISRSQILQEFVNFQNNSIEFESQKINTEANQSEITPGVLKSCKLETKDDISNINTKQNINLKNQGRDHVLTKINISEEETKMKNEEIKLDKSANIGKGNIKVYHKKKKREHEDTELVNEKQNETKIKVFDDSHGRPYRYQRNTNRIENEKAELVKSMLYLLKDLLSDK